MAKGIVIATALVVGFSAAFIYSIQPHDFDSYDLAMIREKLRSEFQSRHAAVEILEVRLERIAVRRAEGFVRWQGLGLPPQVRPCTATMEETSGRMQWYCPEAP